MGGGATMCIIEAMQAQAKRDMAAYRLVWGEGHDMLYTREMAEANLGHIIDNLPSGEFTTREFADAVGMASKSTSAVLGRLRRAGIIERCGEYRQFDGNRSYRMAPIWRRVDA